MEKISFQAQIFDVIKGHLEVESTLVDDLATLLGISTDSAYRRIRGEKIISVEELYAICKHYKLSLDQLMNVDTGMIQFQGNYLDGKTFNFKEYLTNILHLMGYMSSFREKEFYYMCKDLPIFHNYIFREISAFKWFFWSKVYFGFPEFEMRKFKIEDYPDELYYTDQKILELYNLMPSIEVWNIETMNILFRQIDFFRDADILDPETAYKLYDTIEKLWEHLENQAALGYKYDYKDPEKKPMADYKMYFNEVLLGDNSMMVIVDGHKMTYIPHSTINFMYTRDIAFNENFYRHIQNQLRRSTLISTVSEKERSRFFRIVRERLRKRKENLMV